MTTYAIIVIARDRPGIIADVAGALADLGLNLADSSMTVLHGQLAMTLICTGSEDLEQVRSAMRTTAGADLIIHVHTVPDEPRGPGSGRSYLLTVHGADRLGIVARLTGVIAAAGGNITDLSTHLVGDLYALTAEVDLPVGEDPAADGPAALQTSIAEAAAALGVGASLHPLEQDDL